VTTARLALYAGLAPSGGLKFSADTAVYPIWATDQGFESGTVDWTDTQNLESGWLRSRTHTQFLTMKHEAARGRLDIAAPADNKIQISNGLEYDLETLVVADDTGTVYFGKEIPAGGTATLTKASGADLSYVRVQLLSNAPVRPEGMSDNSGFDLLRELRPRYSMYYGGSGPTTNLSQGLMETRIRELQQISPTSGLRKRSYLAFPRENPGVETGLTRTVPEADFHIILGYY
jgi:hypothetical protein